MSAEPEGIDDLLPELIQQRGRACDRLRSFGELAANIADDASGLAERLADPANGRLLTAMLAPMRHDVAQLRLRLAPLIAVLIQLEQQFAAVE